MVESYQQAALPFLPYIICVYKDKSIRKRNATEKIQIAENKTKQKSFFLYTTNIRT